MEKPLVFQQDAATILFSVSIAVWVLFEFSMRIRQRSLLRGRAAHDPSAAVLAACLTASVVGAIQLGQHGPLLWPGGRVWPLVAGEVLIAAGIALAAGDVVSLAVALVLSAIGLAVRIRAEERQLTEALGAQYERFAAHRKRLVPGVW